MYRHLDWLETQGLSPRVRGNHELSAGPGRCERSIPACAGEPVCQPIPTRFVRVYPRVCGGTALDFVGPTVVRGLSPRVRGNLLWSVRSCWKERSIPACAGEPISATCSRVKPRVYPRVCGGTSGTVRQLDNDTGLSPRVRGNPGRQTTRGFGRWGSIPACAGEPQRVLAPPAQPQVYPRVCGGTWNHATNEASGNGLSPRVRGNRGRRVCRRASGGLSPRVRGNRPQTCQTETKPGSIPACAGEPSCGLRSTSLSKVYPRVCGGTDARWQWGTPTGGLSPRVRGNLGGDAAVRDASGSIPACAGEPAGSRRRWMRGLSPRVRGNRCQHCQ